MASELGWVDELKWYSTFVFLFGAIVGFADPITDILTLVEFYRADHKTWFGVGLAFVILPCLVYPVSYLMMWRYDELTEVSRVSLTLQFLVWGLSPFSAALARLRCFIFCLKNFKKLRRGEKSEFTEDTDRLLNHSEWTLFLEATLESAPQFIIQLYAMSVQQEPVQIIQMVSLPVSFFSLAWASTAADELSVDSSDLKAKHKVLRFITHLFLLSSRLFAVAFFTVSYKWWIISVLMIHSIATVTADMFLFCRGEDCGADLVGISALFFEFCLHWLRDDRSLTAKMKESSMKLQLNRFLLFSNVVFIVENITMILIYYFSEFSNTWYSLPVTICVCLFSVLGSTIRVIHYRFLTKEESNDAVSPPSVNNNNLSTTSEPSGDQPQVIVINQGYQQEKE